MSDKDSTNQHIGLYIIITQPQLPYTTIAEKCVKNNIKMMQLREKHLSDRALLKIARNLRAVTRGTHTNLVINDRPDIAMLCEADYLHLGQDDIRMEDARKVVGEMKIGLSTHSREQAREALKQNPAYIGFGPVFPTNAKVRPERHIHQRRHLVRRDDPDRAVGPLHRPHQSVDVHLKNRFGVLGQIESTRASTSDLLTKGIRESHTAGARSRIKRAR